MFDFTVNIDACVVGNDRFPTGWTFRNNPHRDSAGKKRSSQTCQKIEDWPQENKLRVGLLQQWSVLQQHDNHQQIPKESKERNQAICPSDGRQVWWHRPGSRSGVIGKRGVSLHVRAVELNSTTSIRLCAPHNRQSKYSDALSSLVNEELYNWSDPRFWLDRYQMRAAHVIDDHAIGSKNIVRNCDAFVVKKQQPCFSQTIPKLKT